MSKWTAQTYRLVAEVLSTKDISPECRSAIAHRFISAFADDNPAFKPRVFWRACSLEEHGMVEHAGYSADQAMTATFRAQQKLEET